MGIKHLWTILAPFCERKPLYELEGKTVAIDLSCWICEAQNITDYYVQPKMYLRNLYFRTCYLLLMKVNPVFVLEGKAPELKYDTIAARNEIQFKGAKPKKDTIRTGKDRSRFNFVLQRCEEMLSIMGLACITGKGEAEALCAYLNEDKLVDGCISQDSDCFAYGARLVYRNFSISQQGVHASSGGAVDVYDIQKAIESLNFGRNKIIALAILCGSDYSDGVFGIGKEAAMKFFENVSDEDALDRLRSWKTDNKLYDDFYKQLNNKNLCTACGHPGKIHTHTKSGCKDCKLTKGCDSSKFKDKRLQIKNEVNMRSKAIADSHFPNEELIREFLIRKENVSKLDLKWKLPDMINFIKFTTKHLQWEPIYAFEKFLPILTRWQLINFELIKSSHHKLKGILSPERIKKIRNPKGVQSYEIIWCDKEGHYNNIIPTSQLTDVNLEKLWSTIEPQEMVCKAYPDLVEAFEKSKIKPKKPPKRKKKPKEPLEDIENMLANTSISEPKSKKKKNKKPQAMANCKTIDTFFKKAILNNAETKRVLDEDQLNNVENKIVLNENSFNLDASNFGDEDDIDLSNIVEDIVNRSPPKYIQENLDKLGYNQAVIDDKIQVDMSESTFFISRAVENDLFEKSMHYISGSSDEELEVLEDPLETKENVIINDTENTNIKSKNADDSYSEEYIPLLTRIKLKM
ncbi:hypothetical protein ILUMI_09617 [Ignelater luminosus]|uniref:Flap endonuclease GEN n=1 Tax=Ignelater luminosus TaxID=2038154 RepID=A0A8K0D3W8_IGNLU|nr:hypothetical protein ILUMI_09617 [Ignelater luminosus]